MGAASRAGWLPGGANPPEGEVLLRSVRMKSSEIWNRHSFQWQKVGSPLRPCGQDVELLRRAVAEKCGNRGWVWPRALLLGVTPEIATMPWPEGTRLLALDCHRGMIAGVWPRDQSMDSAVACADWTRMPIREGRCEVVVSDCCYSSLDYPNGYSALTLELHRVLKTDGLFAMRAFVRPDRSEPLEAVFNDLVCGRIGNFHVLKWRLAMGLHGDLTAGVRLADIWNAWNEAVPEPDVLASRLGWPMDIIRTIDAYRALESRYTFPTLEELRRTLSARFSEATCVFPAYELGDRCPTMVFERQ